MPLFGSHLSVAGGYYKAVAEAETLGCEALQIFTKNANTWKAKDLTDDEVRRFRDDLGRSRVRRTMAHDSYLINLASPSEEAYRKSIEAFVIEIERADRLGLDYLVTHPGAHMDSGEEDGLVRVAAAFDEVFGRCPAAKVRVLLETTAGQGTSLGWRFEHLAGIIRRVTPPDRLGVCFDTCHVLAAGYPLVAEDDYRDTMRRFGDTIGLDRLAAFHINDSQKPLGSRVDRHAHLGAGHLGLEPFRRLVNDPRFADLPMVLETAKEDGDREGMDAVNLAVLRGLVETSAGGKTKRASGKPKPAGGKTEPAGGKTEPASGKTEPRRKSAKTPPPAEPA